MATLANVLTFARAQAQTDSNGLTDTNGVIFANEALLDFRRRMIERGVDAAQTQESYRDASVPAAGEGSTFLYPTDMFFLKAIEVNYTDTTAQNYRRARQVDVSNLAGEHSFGWLRQNASTDEPQFDDRGDQFEVFPTFVSGNNLSQAIRIFYFLEPTEFAATSDNIGYPESLDYRILGWRIAASYLKSLEKWDSALAFDAEYEKKITKLIPTLGRGSQQPIQATTIPLTGWEF